MRKVSLFLISILLLAVLPGGAQGAETPDEHWTLPKPIIDGQIGTGFDDREAFLLIGSLRALVYKQGVPTGPICTSVNDPKCAGADYFSFGALIEPCTSPTQDNCVEEVIENSKVLSQMMKPISGKEILQRDSRIQKLSQFGTFLPFLTPAGRILC
jgi:hypothetical protein